MRILVVEDDRKIADHISKGLREAGYAVDQVSDGDEGLHFGQNNSYDAAVLDLMLPSRDGLSILEQWRVERVKTPVLILSAKRSVDDRVRGLQAGGDDYLTKPFAFTELLARLQALIRRSTDSGEPTSLQYSGLKLDLLSREVTRDGKKIEDHDPRTRLGLRIRPANECRGCVGLPAAQQGGSRFRPETHSHLARRRLCPP
jgi:DNA-binding response OmpR family regulator